MILRMLKSLDKPTKLKTFTYKDITLVELTENNYNLEDKHIKECGSERYTISQDKMMAVIDYIDKNDHNVRLQSVNPRELCDCGCEVDELNDAIYKFLETFDFVNIKKTILENEDSIDNIVFCSIEWRINIFKSGEIYISKYNNRNLMEDKLFLDLLDVII